METTATVLEKKLADLVYGADPVGDLERSADNSFHATSRKQFALFNLRLISRIEERLSQQFGACLGLLDEQLAIKPEVLAKGFVSSPEYRNVREDLTAEMQTSEARFEIAFLNYVSTKIPMKKNTTTEFEKLFLYELSI